jgi:FAD:protein FMN transferase
MDYDALSKPLEGVQGQSQFIFDAGKFAHAEECMGTVFVFKGRSPFSEDKTRALCERAMDILHEADRIFSTYKPNSPVSRLARGETTLADCPPVVAKVWDDCETWEKITGGWFNAFTPQHTFDPSGLVKTWAARGGAQYLEENGIIDFTLNAGGDIYLTDAVSVDLDWRVAVHKPVAIKSESAGVLTVVDLKGTPFRAVCTSGSAERGEHIWDPKAPGKEAARSLAQVTVVARDLVQADVWATAAFAQGPRAVRQLNDFNAKHPDDKVQLLIVYPDGDLDATEGFVDLFAKG